MPLTFQFKPPRIPLFRKNSDDMRELGETVLASNRERAVRGVNANDVAAKPLTPKYAKRKQRRGLPPIRNLLLDGNMWGAAGVLEVSNDHAHIAFFDGLQQVKANTNNQIDEFFGVARTDDKRVSENAQALVDAKVAAFRQGSR